MAKTGKYFVTFNEFSKIWLCHFCTLMRMVPTLHSIFRKMSLFEIFKGNRLPTNGWAKESTTDPLQVDTKAQNRIMLIIFGKHPHLLDWMSISYATARLLVQNNHYWCDMPVVQGCFFLKCQAEVSLKHCKQSCLEF